MTQEVRGKAVKKCRRGHLIIQDNIYVRSDGREECKKCRISYGRNYYLSHKKQFSDRKKKYRMEHMEQIRKYWREYRNRPEVKIKNVIRAKKFLSTHPWVKHSAGIISRCKCHPSYNGERRLIRNRITREEVKKLWFRDKAWLLKRPSIDRIDTCGDYSMKNCRFIELSENMSRSKQRTKRRATNEKSS